MSNIKQKIIAVVGTTASGKTTLGVQLAYKFNGEIVSADSRQVYRGMDIGTGKDLDEYKLKVENKKEVKIPYHLIDVVSPKTEFNLAKYQRLAYKAIDDILKRNKLPILVGGTGLYAQAVVDNFSIPKGKPDKKLRAQLERKSAVQLLAMLRKSDSKKASSLNESDRQNKRRLIRCVEKTRMATNINTDKHEWPQYNSLIIGLTWPKEVLNKRIYKRLIERLDKQDMIGEVKRLHKNGVSWSRLEGFGLEYKYIALYLQDKLDYEEMVEKINITSRQFAKRQMTWLRRWERQGAGIHWVKSRGEAEKLVKEFLK